MANFVTGAIVSIGATQNLTSRNGNAFRLRDIVISIRKYDPNTGEPITDRDNTPQFTFMGERCDELDKYQPGQMVNIYFDLQGRTYVDQSGISKIINEVRPYKIELYQSRSQQQTSNQPLVQPQQNVQQTQVGPCAQQKVSSNPIQQNTFNQQQSGYYPQQQGFVDGDPF